jgi:hypothetical protein
MTINAAICRKIFLGKELTSCGDFVFKLCVILVVFTSSCNPPFLVLIILLWACGMLS